MPERHPAEQGGGGIALWIIFGKTRHKCDTLLFLARWVILNKILILLCKKSDENVKDSVILTWGGIVCMKSSNRTNKEIHHVVYKAPHEQFVLQLQVQVLY